MEIERYDGTKERRTYDSIDKMIKDAKKVVRDPTVKRIILYPKFKIPKKRSR